MAAALEQWLAAEPGEFHLFHDLYGIPGYKPNIDHVILTGTGWLELDAKWCPAGMLTFSAASMRGGWLQRRGGSWANAPWLDRGPWTQSALVSLTGQPGGWGYVVPDHTAVTESVASARCLMGDHGGLRGAVFSLADVSRQAKRTWPSLFDPSRCADPERISALERHVRSGNERPATARIGPLGS